MVADRPPGSEVAEQSTAALNGDVWVIVPAYNEATIITSVVRELRRRFANVVVVDDGSADTTARDAELAGARVVRHCVNLGQGAAIQTGLDFVLLDPRARWFVTFDADGQHDPADAAAMVERLRREDVHVLLGSRFLGNTSGVRRSRRALLRAARAFERLTSGVRLTDAHNGLRAFSREFACRVQLTMSDFAHASQLLEQVVGSRLAYDEHPVTVRYSDYARNKGQRSINSINIAVDVWMHHLLRGAD